MNCGADHSQYARISSRDSRLQRNFATLSSQRRKWKEYGRNSSLDVSEPTKSNIGLPISLPTTSKQTFPSRVMPNWPHAQRRSSTLCPILQPTPLFLSTSSRWTFKASFAPSLSSPDGSIRSTSFRRLGSQVGGSLDYQGGLKISYLRPSSAQCHT